MKALMKEIIELSINRNWDCERDILDLLEKHFPGIKFKDLYD